MDDWIHLNASFNIFAMNSWLSFYSLLQKRLIFKDEEA